MRRAYTLLEILITIATLGVLVTIVLPRLLSTKDRAAEARQLLRLRTHAQVVSMYLQDFGDAFPCPLQPRPGLQLIRCEHSGQTVEAKYFDVFQFWNIALADRYYDGDPDSAVFGTRTDDHRAGVNSFAYSPVFLAKPTYWNLRTRTRLADQVGPTYGHEAAFPSNKIVFVDWESAGFNEQSPGGSARAPSAFIDAHAAVVAPSQLSTRGPPLTDLAGQASDFALSYLSPIQTPQLYTLDGVRGRDTR